MRGILAKYIGFVVMFVSFNLGIATTLLAQKYYHPVKSTGRVTLLEHSSNTYYFLRPNKELFVMIFDGPTALYQNQEARTIYYQDVNSGLQHFVKVQY